MTERLAEITAHIHSVHQLGSVIGAMRAIAAARAQQSRLLLPGIRAYAGVIAQAIAQALRLLPEDHAVTGGVQSVRTGLILFTAEQGFAGALSDRMLEAARPLLSHADVFLVGTRGGCWLTNSACIFRGGPGWHCIAMAPPLSLRESATRSTNGRNRLRSRRLN